MSILVVAIVAVLVVIGLTKTQGMFGPVERKRLLRFAQRQQLAITVDNGNDVIRYLATTRRWRVAGLLTSVVLSAVWGWHNHGLTFGSLQLLSGWFAGAVIAEWRIARPPAGRLRAASLQPREAAAYVSRTDRLAPTIVAALTAALVMVGLFLHASHDVHLPALVTPMAAAAALAGVARLVEQRILDRPQPFTAADVVAADDAMRSRSLHVVSGAVTVLVLSCLFFQCASLAETYAHTTTGGGLNGVASIGSIVAAIAGWNMANRRWAVRRDLDAPPRESAA
jgi:hypothetical protein